MGDLRFGIIQFITVHNGHVTKYNKIVQVLVKLSIISA